MKTPYQVITKFFCRSLICLMHNIYYRYIYILLHLFIGKNPRPICISPPRISNLKVCAKFYNVFFPGRNFHFCLAMSGKWGSFQLFNFVFDCLRYVLYICVPFLFK